MNHETNSIRSPDMVIIHADYCLQVCINTDNLNVLLCRFVMNLLSSDTFVTQIFNRAENDEGGVLEVQNIGLRFC